MDKNTENDNQELNMDNKLYLLGLTQLILYGLFVGFGIVSCLI